MKGKQKMKELLEGYRIIDLSMPIYPGVLKTDNTYVWSQHQRRFEAKQFIATAGMCFMHFIDTETHIGTHVEGPAHLINGAPSPADLPLTTYIGEALIMKCEPIALGPKEFSKVKKGDIVLLYCDRDGCWVTPEAGKYLMEIGIKMLGVQNVVPDDPRAFDLNDGTIKPETHKYLLGNNIPIIEELCNIEETTQERCFFIGLPLRIYNIDSSWIRAIVFEKE